MKRSVRVSLSFATMRKDELNSFILLVLVCLKNNLLFPNLPIQVTGLAVLQTMYEDAMNASAIGGRKDSAAYTEARDNLIMALRQTAAYIQSLNLTESQVLTSGFDVVVWNKTKITLVGPAMTGLDNSMSGQLGVEFQALYGAKAYQVQYCVVAGPWVDAGIWPNTKDIVIPNLAPGIVHSVRVRGIGGETRYGPWSVVLSLMVT